MPVVQQGETLAKADPQSDRGTKGDSAQTSHLIHIGFPKCASKFLQRWFAEHPEVAYATDRFGGLSSVHDLIADVLDGPHGRFCRVTSNEELSDPRDPSTFGAVETASADRRRQRLRQICEELAALFPSAKILMITRNQADMVVSGYSQIIKQGGSITDADRVRFAAEGFPDLHPFDYDLTLKLYREHFAGRVLCLPYELLVDDRKAFLTAIADFMGVSRFDIAASRVNASLDGEQLYWYPRIARLLQFVPGDRLRRKLIGLHVRMIRSGAWRPVINILGLIAGKKSVERELAPEILQKLRIDCEELLKIDCYAPYRDIYRDPQLRQ